MRIIMTGATSFVGAAAGGFWRTGIPSSLLSARLPGKYIF